MTIELVWALLWQVLALVMVAVVLRRRFFRFTGALLLLALVAFHGLPEILLVVSSRQPRYRDVLTGDQLRNWLWFVGPATAVYAAVYLAVLGDRRRSDPSDDRVATAQSAAFFKWQCWVPVAVPLYLVALSGSGYVPGAQGSSYFQSGVTGQFLLVGIALASFSVIMRFGHTQLVFVVQSIALLLLGQRLTVVAGIALLGFLVARHGIRPTRRQITLAIPLVVLALLVVSSARITSGRAEFGGGAGPAQRLDALLAGSSAIFAGDTRDQLLDDYVFRLDANYLGVRVLDALTEDADATPVGGQTLVNMMNLAVPRFLNPAKLDS